jgi:hypothetical protein
MSRCWETELPLFFQPCAIRQRGRHRCLIVLFSFALAHVHHSKSSHPWYPHIWINSQALALKGKRPLEEILCMTIAIPIAPLYMLYERFMGGESFIKLFKDSHLIWVTWESLEKGFCLTLVARILFLKIIKTIRWKQRSEHGWN